MRMTTRLIAMLLIVGGAAQADTFLTIDDEADLTNAIEFIQRMNEAFGDTYSQPIVRIYTNKPCAVISNVWSKSDEYWKGFKDGAKWAVSNGYDQCSHTTNWAFTNCAAVVTNYVTVTQECHRAHIETRNIWLGDGKIVTNDAGVEK